MRGEITIELRINGRNTINDIIALDYPCHFNFEIQT